MIETKKFQILSDEEMAQIHKEALDILENSGVCFAHDQMLKTLKNKGCPVDMEKSIVRFPKDLVRQAMSAIPKQFNLYNTGGKVVMELGCGNTYYAPGPGAPVLARQNRENRSSRVSDFEKAVQITETSASLSLNAGSLVPSDVPSAIVDIYMLYFLLKYSKKSLLGEAWKKNSVKRIARLLDCISGSKEKFREKPYVILAACPSGPMQWEWNVIENVIDCVKYGIPVFACSSPIMGISSAVTIASAVLSHTVENLSLLTAIQLYKPGFPVLYGGIPGSLDMRTAYCSESSIEAGMATVGFVNMAKYYDMPSLCFLSQTDSKESDYQAGFESCMGAMLATISGVDIVFGAGTLNSYQASSNEKLAMDGQFLGYMNRLQQGLQVDKETLAKDAVSEIASNGKADFISSPHTVQWFRREQFIPNSIIDRLAYDKWAENESDIVSRANNETSRLTSDISIDENTRKILKDTMMEICKEMELGHEELTNLEKCL